MKLSRRCRCQNVPLILREKRTCNFPLHQVFCYKFATIKCYNNNLKSLADFHKSKGLKSLVKSLKRRTTQLFWKNISGFSLSILFSSFAYHFRRFFQVFSASELTRELSISFRSGNTFCKKDSLNLRPSNCYKRKTLP